MLHEIALFTVGFEQSDASFGQYQLKRQARYASAGTDVDDATSVEPACCRHAPASLNGDPEGADEELLDDSIGVFYGGEISAATPLDQQLAITPEALGCGVIDLYPDGTCRLD